MRTIHVLLRLIAAVFLIIPPVWAAEADSPAPLTLKQAERLALSANPGLAAAQAAAPAAAQVAPQVRRPPDPVPAPGRAAHFNIQLTCFTPTRGENGNRTVQ